MNFNEKLINLRKSKGLSQEELGNELKVSRQTISKWESCQSYPDFQRLVLLSDFFGLTLDELVRDIDVQEVREKNLNNEKLSSIYDDINEGKKFIRLCYIIGTGVLIFFSLIVLYGVFLCQIYASGGSKTASEHYQNNTFQYHQRKIQHNEADIKINRTERQWANIAT